MFSILFNLFVVNLLLFKFKRKYCHIHGRRMRALQPHISFTKERFSGPSSLTGLYTFSTRTIQIDLLLMKKSLRTDEEVSKKR